MPTDDDLFGPVKTETVKAKKKPKAADKTTSSPKDSPITPCLVIKTSQCEVTIWNLPIPSWLS